MAKYLEQGEVDAGRSCTRRSRRRCAKATSCRSASCRRAPARASPSCSTSSSSSRPIRPKATRRCSPRAKATARSSSAPSPIRSKHVLAHVFKVVMDPFVGKLGVFRVHQGTVTTRHAALRRRRPQAVQGRPPVHAAGRQERRDRQRGARRHRRRRQGRRDRRSTACCTIRTTRTTSTCSRSSSRCRCTASRSRRSAAATSSGISDVLHKMIAEDPTLVARARPDLNETVLRGLGDLHLRSVLERMASQFKLEVETRPPRIPYRETITAQGRGPPSAQEADRRRGPVRRGVPAASSRCRAAPASSSSTR